MNNELNQYKCDYCDGISCKNRADIEKRFQMVDNECRIFECTNCHLVSVFPRPTYKENFLIYTDYELKKGRLEVEKYRQEKIYPAKLKKIKRYVKGDRLLDIGAGLGTFAHEAKKLGFDVTGIELSQEQSARAKELYGINLINRDIFECYEELGRFDVIHIHHVLEHILSPSELFSVLGKLLNSGGVIVLEVPYELQRIQELIFRGKDRKWNGDHLYFFSPKTLNNYFRKNGFFVMEFNQYLVEQDKYSAVSAPRYFLRYLFRKITTYFQIPSGSFMEMYAVKK
jgi:SAM-dependent methyltransferase